MSGAEDIKRNVRWYQTILARACGYVDVPVNGNHNDPVTKTAMRDFQRSYGLDSTGFLTVESNVALNQVALQWIYRRVLPNKVGKSGEILKDQIKEFQTDYGLENDGKVGPMTMGKMMQALDGSLPPPYGEWEPELGTEPFLSTPDAESETGTDTAQELAAGPADPGVIQSDDREPQSDTAKAPNRWVCLLDVAADIWDLGYQANGIDKTRGGFTWSLGGTGLLISPRHVLTAAHVVQQLGEPGGDGRYAKFFTASSAQVAPGYNGAYGAAARKMFRQPYGSFGSQRFRCPSGYVSFGKRSVIPNGFEDFALIELPQPVHRLAPTQVRRFLLNGKWHEEKRPLPPLGYWGDSPGFQIQAITPKQLQGQAIQTIGYPSKIPDTGVRPRKRWMQWMARGKVDNSLSNSANHPFLLFHTADTTNSQSGSPIWTVSRAGNRDIHTLVGIVTAAGDTYNVAVALTDRVLKQIQQWAPDTFDYNGTALVVKG